MPVLPEECVLRTCKKNHDSQCNRHGTKLVLEPVSVLEPMRNTRMVSETIFHCLFVVVFVVLVTKSSLTLHDSVDHSPARLLCPWDFPVQSTGVGGHLLTGGK